MAAKPKAAKKATKKHGATPAPRKPTANEVLEQIGIGEICRRLASGEGQGEIADSIGVNRGTFSIWLAADDKRSTRAREARTTSARHWDAQAEAVLIAADDDKPGSIAKARELASHYRWRAKCYAPKEYGDKLDLTAAVTVQELSEEQLQAKAKVLSDKLGLSSVGLGMQNSRAKTEEQQKQPEKR